MNDEVSYTDADTLRQYLREAGYSQRAAARELRIEDRTMRRYLSGTQAVPPTVFLSIRHLAMMKRNNEVIAQLQDGTLSTSDGPLTMEQFKAHNLNLRRAIDYLTERNNNL
jgi:hypothetical protein